MTLQPLTDDELPALPKALNHRREQRKNGGYCLVPAYTPDELHAAQRQAAEAQRLKSEQEAAARIAELEAWCAELEKDARRYQLVRDALMAGFTDPLYGEVVAILKHQQQSAYASANSFDAAIDAALNTKEQQP